MVSRAFALVLLVSLLIPGIAAAQGSLPEGFEDTLVANGLNAPTAIAFAPDGRLFICLQGGAVRIFKQGQLLSTPFLQLAVSCNVERGLLGMATAHHLVRAGLRTLLVDGADFRFAVDAVDHYLALVARQRHRRLRRHARSRPQLIGSPKED